MTSMRRFLSASSPSSGDHISALRQHLQFGTYTIEEILKAAPMGPLTEQIKKQPGLLVGLVRGRPDEFEVSTDDSGVTRITVVPDDRPSGLPLAPTIDAALRRHEAIEGSGSHDLPELSSPASAETAMSESSPLFALLHPLTPSAFFIPLAHVVRGFDKHTRRRVMEACDVPRGGELTIHALFEELSRLPAGELDVRVLGDAEEDVYIRSVAERLPCFLESEQADEFYAEYDITHLAGPLHAALVNRGRVSVADLEEHLDPALFSALPLTGPAAILIFDRLQYAFDVDLQGYTVAAKQYADMSATGLSTRTTPNPRALRYVLTHLQEPIHLDEVWNELPEEISGAIRSHFEDFSSFVAAHPLYLFVKDEGVLWSTELHRRFQARASRISGGSDESGVSFQDVREREVAEEIVAYLPEDRAVHFDRLKRIMPPEYLASMSKRNPRAFFERFPDLFVTFALLQQKGFVIQHSRLPVPINAIPPLISESDVLRVCAIYLLSPKHPDHLSMLLPQGSKKFFSRHGGLRKFLQRHHRFFTYNGDCFRYVGHFDSEKRAEAITEARQQREAVESAAVSSSSAHDTWH